jgi:hypothetical protein
MKASSYFVVKMSNFEYSLPLKEAKKIELNFSALISHNVFKPATLPGDSMFSEPLYLYCLLLLVLHENNCLTKVQSMYKMNECNRRAILSRNWVAPLLEDLLLLPRNL